MLAAIERLAAGEPGARIACVNVLKLARLALDRSEDEAGRNLHLLRLAELKHWAAPLARLPNQLTYHVIEAIDPAAALIEFARRNHVQASDHRSARRIEGAPLYRQRLGQGGRRSAVLGDGGAGVTTSPPLPSADP